MSAQAGKDSERKTRFSSNVDLIEILFEENPNALARVLMDWLTGGHVVSDENASRRLAHVLGLLSESTLYNMRKPLSRGKSCQVRKFLSGPSRIPTGRARADAR